MKKGDQYFEPGTKVIRVTDSATLGLSCVYSHIDPRIWYGVVLCVSECGPCHDGWNGVNFVGIPIESGCRWKAAAACFRRIEEIQLCVRAAEKFKQNEEVEV